jgi:Ca2+-binding EF-hand superfamily protein
MRSTLATGLVLTGIVLAGCQSASSTGSDAHMGLVAPPMSLDDTVDSTWVYLVRKYDDDGDERITPDEYDRKGGNFDRLDRNEDGALTASDFERDPNQRRNMMRGMRAQRVVAMYFQVDDHGSLSLDELQQAVAMYDANGDGRIEETEFAALAEDRKVEDPGGGSRRMRRAMRDVEPWGVLLGVIDVDQDGVITSAEFVAFFKSRDDGDLVWSMDRPRGRRGEGRPAGGAAEGEMAPDFALQPPDGGPTVMLSSFRKNLPVALIFGSYT